MENDTQFITRHVVAEYLEGAAWPELAERLRDGDPAAVGTLRSRIETARKAWSQTYAVHAIRHAEWLWSLRPTLVEAGEDGHYVKFSWGWAADDDDAACPSVTSTAEDAFDMANEVLQLFAGEDGQPVRPPPISRRGIDNPEFEASVARFHEMARELSEALGQPSSGCSLREVRAWAVAGKPVPPVPHAYVDHPEDHVKVCSVCGSWYSTHPHADDFPSRVCSGKPLQGEHEQSIHVFDPRRSPELRQAQRLERLTYAMSVTGATPLELDPFIDRLNEAIMDLNDAELARYEKERVGLSEAPR